MTSWIYYVLLTLCKISDLIAVAEYIRVNESTTSMTDAFVKCRAEGGHLLSDEELHRYAENITEHCPHKSNKFYWIGNYSILTPFMYPKGCFVYKEFDPNMFIIEDNSIAKCYARCSTYHGIAIKTNSCQCYTNSSNGLDNLEPLDAGYCPIDRSDEDLDELLSGMIVYIFDSGDYTADGINPFCFYGKCDGSRFITYLACNEKESAKVICSNSDLNIGASHKTSSSWREAMGTCISNRSSYLLTPGQFKADSGSLCTINDNSLTWTNQRQYRDRIHIPDEGLQEKFIFSPTLVCQYASMTDLSSKETHICNDKGRKTFGYLCFVDAPKTPSLSSNSCIVNLSPTTTVQSSVTSEGTSPTTKVTYEMSQFITTEYSEINTDPNYDVASGTTNEGGNTSPETTDENYRDEISAHKSVDNDSQGHSLGVIIGAAVGGGVALLIAVITVIIMKRHFEDGNGKDHQIVLTNVSTTFNKAEAMYSEATVRTNVSLLLRKKE